MQSRVAATHRKAQTIVLGLLVSVFICIAIGFWLAGSRAVTRTGQTPYAFIVGVIFLALGAMALRRTQFRRLRLQAIGEARGVEGLLRHLFAVTVVSAALAEAIGVLAILVGVLTGEQFYVIVFGVVAFVVLLSSYPFRLDWERAAQYFASNGQK
jgi:surface polysaccharide O-acyltransferase-like enzyme